MVRSLHRDRPLAAAHADLAQETVRAFEAFLVRKAYPYEKLRSVDDHWVCPFASFSGEEPR